MTGLLWGLFAVMVVLVLGLAAGLVWGVRTISRLDTRVPQQRQDGVDPLGQADREQHEQALAALRSAASEAAAAVEQTRMVAATTRADAEAAKAEANAARAEAARLLEAARAEAAQVLEAARAEAGVVLERAHQQERRYARDLERLSEREQRLQRAEAELAEQHSRLARQQAALAEAEQQRQHELERVSGLTAEAARAELVAVIEAQAKREAAVLVRDLEAEARRSGEQRARHIVAEAIQRVASEQTTESAVSVLHLPSDDMKGRIIGREGRNIRTFEAVTGVNLIVDDTPEAVLLSCFDPVRREVARVTMERLVADGRIHPHRIEEVAAAASREVSELCQRAAEDALVEVGITDLHPELVTLLGRLRYRTSYGQNVLRHLIETAHLAGLLASELGLEPLQARAAKRAAFLHDIGKALTHEAEGSHAMVGAEVARRYGESDEVVHAIEAHHNEVTPQTVAAVLTQAADACSGGRPGARREGLQAYVKRLERIEEIAAGKPGVEKVYAMQAGREVRVMVRPEDVDDIGAAVLARDVAKQIEEELTYPGQVRVTVVRELRATETAR